MLDYVLSNVPTSLAGDTACSSAAHSLHDAIADITAGRTDYAIVLGSCHILAPNMTLAFHRLHMLSPEGACKAFDAAGNGCDAALPSRTPPCTDDELFTDS